MRGFRCRVLLAVSAVATLIVALAGTGRAADQTHRGSLREFSSTSKTLLSAGPAIRCLALSPDGRFLATDGPGHALVLRDAESGRPRKVLTGHTDRVAACAFAPTGETLVSVGDDQTVRLWDTASGRLRNTLRGHTNWIVDAAFASDGHMLATCGYDGTVRLGDANTGQQQAVLEGHTGVVRSLAFGKDASMLVSGGDDGTVRVWNPEAEASLLTIDAADVPVRTVAVSPDGTRIASGTDEGAVRLWDADTGAEIRALAASRSSPAHKAAVWRLAFSPQGRMLATGDYAGEVKLWNVATGELIQELHGPSDAVSGLAFAPGTDALFAASYDGTVRVWKAKLPLSAPLAELPADKKAWAVTVAPAGRTLAVAGKDGFVKQWDLETGKPLRNFDGHPDTIDDIAFSPDGKLLAVVGWRSEQMTLLDAASGERVHTFRAENRRRAVSFAPDGRTLVTTSKEGAAHFKDVESGKGVATLLVAEQSVDGLACSPDGTLVATGSGDWTTDDSGEVVLWDAETRTEIARLQGHARAVRSVAFGPQGRRLASADHGGVVKLWDVPGRSERATFRNDAGARPCVFSPDGNLLAVGLHDGTVNVWDTRRREVVQRLRAGDDLFGLAFSGDGSLIVGVDGGKRALVWQVGDPRPDSLAAKVREWSSTKTDGDEDSEPEAEEAKR